jgi:antitoxin PrlF
MPQATITSKGRMTIPRAVRRAAGLKTGDVVSIHAIGNGVFVVRPKRPMVDRLAGALAAPGCRRVSSKASDDATTAAQFRARGLMGFLPTPRVKLGLRALIDAAPSAAAKRGRARR